MARPHSHAAKKHIVHNAGNRESEMVPPRSNPPASVEEKYIPPFMAWPSYLFEKMINPWRNVTSVVSQVDSWRVGNRITIPKSTSRETDKEYHYLVELPGITRDQIALHFHNGTITLRVEASEAQRTKGYYSQHSHSIRRAFTLPVYTDAAAITAQLKEGMLIITIPKTDTPISSKSQTIEIT